MSFFESLVVLLLAAIALLQVSRRFSLPYPAMLAAAGVLVALIPGSPTIRIDPQTALALFIAPALLDAGFDFPLGVARRMWRPLVTLAVLAVLLTTAAVAWIGVEFAGLPLAAAVALGAIVAPPDAAAATAVMRSVSLPRTTAALLRGESLFNDATALLLFGAAVAVQTNRGVDGGVVLGLLAAAPGGILLGIGMAFVFGPIGRFVGGTLGGSLLQFVTAFLVWMAAEHLGLSAVLAMVAFAMTIARRADRGSPRMRVHSYALWAAVVFLLNVLAFLLMGMQARVILAHIKPGSLANAVKFAGMVIAATVIVRFIVVVAFNRLALRFSVLRGDLPKATLRQAVVVSWCGMRGLVTLATSFALPASFPQRDLIVLTAFGVVLATLVVQGLTLTPLIRVLKLHQFEDLDEELASARAKLASGGLASLEGESGPEAENLRYQLTMERDARSKPESRRSLEKRVRLGLASIARKREVLHAMRDEQRIRGETFDVLQEELDWRELTLLPTEDRQIEEN